MCLLGETSFTFSKAISEGVAKVQAARLKVSSESSSQAFRSSSKEFLEDYSEMHSTHSSEEFLERVSEVFGRD
jgi:hypothetical protein